MATVLREWQKSNSESEAGRRGYCPRKGLLCTAIVAVLPRWGRICLYNRGRQYSTNITRLNQACKSTRLSLDLAQNEYSYICIVPALIKYALLLVSVQLFFKYLWLQSCGLEKIRLDKATSNLSIFIKWERECMQCNSWKKSWCPAKKFLEGVGLRNTCN